MNSRDQLLTKWDNLIDRVTAKSRDLTARSQAAIIRSRRLKNGTRDMFSPIIPDLTEEQHVTAMDRHHADIHQREIDREIRATLHGGNPLS